MTEPGFIASTMSLVQSSGASRFGISAVVMTMSMSGASSRNFSSCASRNSGLDGGGIAAGRGAVLLLFLEIEEDELGAHRFDLLGHFGAHVEGIGDRAQRGRGADGGKTRHAGADDQHLGRRHLARRGDLPGEEAAEVVARLDHRAVARDVGHRRQRVHLLRAADARHHVHRDDGGAPVLGALPSAPRSEAG